MGYTTDFNGHFTLNKKLEPALHEYLVKFNESRRMRRKLPSQYGTEGEFYVDGVGAGIKVSMIWLLGMYMMHTLGELCLSPIGLSLFNKLAPIKFASLLMAVWFLASAAANKLAGVLSALYPDGKTTHFMGYEMNNLYDFFILFVVMSGIAAGMLLILTRKLQKLMNN